MNTHCLRTHLHKIVSGLVVDGVDLRKNWRIGHLLGKQEAALSKIESPFAFLCTILVIDRIKLIWLLILVIRGQEERKKVCEVGMKFQSCDQNKADSRVSRNFGWNFNENMSTRIV